ncbi:MAG: FMN-binding negative transcriptional regulator [Rhodoferax sp.]
MYLPAQFKADERLHAIRIMREHPFSSLIGVDDTGLPFVSHIPLHLEQTGDELVLLGHVAKPNPHWRFLKSRPKALVAFMGPHAYLSPAVYPDLLRVPTWNYLAVHCTVQATLIEEADAKDRLLKKLIADHEPAYAQQWRSLGPEFAARMLAGIVGFELRVTELQCKLKINQHRPESHASMKDMYLSGNENERALARWMQRLGLATEPSEGND